MNRASTQNGKPGDAGTRSTPSRRLPASSLVSKKVGGAIRSTLALAARHGICASTISSESQEGYILTALGAGRLNISAEWLTLNDDDGSRVASTRLAWGRSWLLSFGASVSVSRFLLRFEWTLARTFIISRIRLDFWRGWPAAFDPAATASELSEDDPPF